VVCVRGPGTHRDERLANLLPYITLLTSSTLEYVGVARLFPDGSTRRGNRFIFVFRNGVGRDRTRIGGSDCCRITIIGGVGVGASIAGVGTVICVSIAAIVTIGACVGGVKEIIVEDGGGLVDLEPINARHVGLSGAGRQKLGVGGEEDMREGRPEECAIDATVAVEFRIV